MSEKFNSGLGGYICDHCRALLYAGRKEKHYIYNVKEEDIVEDWELKFCSIKCRDDYKDD